MARQFLWSAVAALTLVLMLPVGVVISIRTSLARFSDDASRTFPGDRVEALARVVDCASCAIE